MPPPKILTFAASLRHDSYNKKLVRIAARAAEQAGAQVNLIDLRDLPMPIYDGDLEREHGLPANAKAFKQMMIAADGFLIATPEYNKMMPALLKNSIDWASRAEPNEAPLAAFTGKVAAVMGASPGALAAIRGAMQARLQLSLIGTLVLPDELGIARAHEAFNEDGSLKDAKQQQSVAALAAKLVAMIRKLKSEEKS
jgi:chromate reductase, NAD(P)H dehydrogenase (quinone)